LLWIISQVTNIGRIPPVCGLSWAQNVDHVVSPPKLNEFRENADECLALGSVVPLHSHAHMKHTGDIQTCPGSPLSGRLK
jgi:hypothetical protein